MGGETLFHGAVCLGLLPCGVRALITAAEGGRYIAGCIILAAARCTAMVFVWSHLAKGDAAYTSSRYR